MSSNWNDLLDDMDTADDSDDKETYNIVKAPFGYPGSKNRSLKYILPHLPYTGVYVEPFGGSGAVLLARRPSRLEVYNDRYGGVTAFYRVLRDPELFPKFMDWISLTVHSREDWAWCHETWQDVYDPVERAARWFYMTRFSFGQIGRNFGRVRGPVGLMARKIQKQLPLFPLIHERFTNVQIENLDWRTCIKDYDRADAVFYMDPPYLDAAEGSYFHNMKLEQHKELLATIFEMKAYVVISGYSNPLYENQDWDERFSWDVQVSLQPMAFTEGNGKKQLEYTKDQGRPQAEEVLWIKKVRS
jgi:DNA adenine methylase